MMKQKLIYFLLAIFVFASCKNSTNESENQSKKVETAEIQKKEEAVKKDTNQIADYQKETTSDETAKKIQTFLSDKNKADIEKDLLTEDDRKFSFYEIDLNEDGKNEYFIQLEGQYFCGNGGCSYYLLNNDMSVNTYFTVTNPPVFRSSGKTDGWHDLILFGDNNQDNGVKNYIHLKYDKSKRKYPSNPSLIKKTDIAPGGSDFVMWHDEYSKAKPFTF